MALFCLALCGSKLSNCCVILSIWGIVMLLFLGLFFQVKSVALREDVDNMSDYKKTSRNCFLAAGVYVITLAVAFRQKWMNQRASTSPKL